MKRFLLFKGYMYYPGGGWDDFVGDFDTIEAAVVKAPIGRYDEFGEDACDWYHVVDMQTRRIVAKDARGDLG